MKYLPLVALLLVTGCSSPTAPTSTPPPVTVNPSVVIAPPVVTPPTPNPLLSDSRFDLNFYRMFALGTLEYIARPLQRQTQAPKIYLRTIDDTGASIDSDTLNQTSNAIETTAGLLTGVFGVAGIERGTASRIGQAGWITISWSTQPSEYCGFGLFGGDSITLYPRTPGCRCAGGPAVRLRTVKHELGHALGFYHTNSPNDLMSTNSSACDQNPSDREVFHARVAYEMPIGSLDPK